MIDKLIEEIGEALTPDKDGRIANAQDLARLLKQCRDRMRCDDIEAIRKACDMVNNALSVKLNHVDVGGIHHIQIPRREFMAVHDGLHFARNALSALSQPPQQEQQEQSE